MRPRARKCSDTETGLIVEQQATCCARAVGKKLGYVERLLSLNTEGGSGKKSRPSAAPNLRRRNHKPWRAAEFNNLAVLLSPLVSCDLSHACGPRRRCRETQQEGSMSNRQFVKSVLYLAFVLVLSGLLAASCAAQTWFQLPTLGSPPTTGAGGVGYDATNNRVVAFFPSNVGARSWRSPALTVLADRHDECFSYRNGPDDGRRSFGGI